METKNTKTCAYCGKEFESTRRNKIYCSPECNQKAYYERKISSDELENLNSEKIKNLPDRKNEIIFDISEYNDFISFTKQTGFKENLTFKEYCFFRKKFIGEIDFDLFAKSIDEYDLYDIYNTPNSTIKKEFDKFTSEFESGTYKIITSKKIEKKPTDNRYNFPTNFR